MAVQESTTRRLRGSADLQPLEAWLPAALKRFGVPGYGRNSQHPMTAERLRAGLDSGVDLLHAALLDGPEGRGLILVEYSRWEEGVIGKPFAKVVFLGADSFDGARALLAGATDALKKAGVV